MGKKEVSTENKLVGGKPTCYLDHNILDLYVEGKEEVFFKKLMNSFSIVYSDETLREIHRSKGFEDKFLIGLTSLGAFHMQIILEGDEFKDTGKVTFRNVDPFEAYSQYCENSMSFGEVIHGVEEWLYKFSGGRKEDDIREIHDEERQVFSDVMNQMQSLFDDLTAENPEIVGYFDEYSNDLKIQFDESLSEIEELMNQNNQGGKGWSGIKDLREWSGIGPKELNNIGLPNVLNKIWVMFNQKNSMLSEDLDIDDFFGVKENPLYPDREYFNHQKVTSIYQVLNVIGYFPDSRVQKRRRFTAALSDQGHASMASFCNILLSRDEAFVKKTQAAYEYLNVSTMVGYVSLGS